MKDSLGFYPDNYKFYKIALTHRSASIKAEDGTLINNERLEFLGDAILDAVVAHFLFLEYPNENEGFLTQMRSKIVKREFLNKLAKKIGFNRLIISHTSKNSIKKNIYGDALEAFIGAMYLDRGYIFTKKYIIKKLINNHIDLANLKSTDTNYKSQLLEWVQKYKKEMSIDTDTDPTQPDKFISYIRIEREICGTGIGFSKKEAEQKAAGRALYKVNGN
ncbi:MAG: ribonuclease III [Bacteroidota bacterium]|nr:ribonuclease III [Bacteroidota bacterium]